MFSESLLVPRFCASKRPFQLPLHVMTIVRIDHGPYITCFSSDGPTPNVCTDSKIPLSFHCFPSRPKLTISTRGDTERRTSSAHSCDLAKVSFFPLQKVYRLFPRWPTQVCFSLRRTLLLFVFNSLIYLAGSRLPFLPQLWHFSPFPPF